MRRTIYMALAVAALASVVGCTGKTDRKDRSDARRMFSEIAALTESYTRRVAAAPDSAAWAEACVQFEDSLDKINFSFPADTDLLLSEGQNDTIGRLLKAYIAARDERIRVLLHPVLPADSVVTDSLADASRSPGS